MKQLAPQTWRMMTRYARKNRWVLNLAPLPRPAARPEGGVLRAEAKAADGFRLNEDLETDQKPIAIGTPIPVVFGFNVWCSPPAAFVRYRNDGASITSVHCVCLGEGQLGGVSEVRWGSLPADSWKWAYGATPTGIDYKDNIKQFYRFETETKVSRIKAGGQPWSLTEPFQISRCVPPDYSVRIESSGNNCTNLTTLVRKINHTVRYSYYRVVNSAPGVSEREATPEYLWPVSVSWSQPSSSGNPAKRAVTVTAREINCLRIPVPSEDLNYANVTDDYELTVRETRRFDQPFPTDLPAERGDNAGSKAGLMMLTATKTGLVEDGRYKHQVHVKISAGLVTSRYLSSSNGSTQNFCDVVRYLLGKSAALPASLRDDTALQNAARFTEANGLHFNGVLDTQQNLLEWLGFHAPLFMCAVTQDAGKIGLKPLLPTSGNLITTNRLTYRASFTTDDILAGSYSKEWTPRVDRILPRLSCTWFKSTTALRTGQRTTDVRYAGTALDGPYESFDFSGFCTSSGQAQKIARFILARRKWVRYSVTFSVPQRRASNLLPGDYIRLTLATRSNIDAATTETMSLQITDLFESSDGSVRITADEHPVYDGGRSWIARDVLVSSAFAYD